MYVPFAVVQAIAKMINEPNPILEELKFVKVEDFNFIFTRKDANEIDEKTINTIKEFISFIESEKIELTEYQIIVCIAHMFAHNILVAGPMRSGRSYALSTLRKFYEYRYPFLCATIKGHHV